MQQSLLMRAKSRTLAALSCLALAAAGCGGTGDDRSDAKALAPGQNFTADGLERLAVQSSDLPSGYKEQGRESESRAECLKAQTREEATLADRLAALGLKACSTVGYRKEVRTGGDREYNSATSAAFLFRSARGAQRHYRFCGDSTRPAFTLRGKRASSLAENRGCPGWETSRHLVWFLRLPTQQVRGIGWQGTTGVSATPSLRSAPATSWMT